MTNKINFLTLSIFCLIFTACASQVGVTYYTTPQGAYITDTSGKQHGITPIRLVFNWEKNHVDQNGCLRTNGITAKWVSGVTASSPEIITVCNRGEAHYTLQRPNDAPGLDKDMKFSLQIQNSIQSNRNASDLNAILMYDAIVNN